MSRTFAEAVMAGDVGALARAITLIESGNDDGNGNATRLLEELRQLSSNRLSSSDAIVVGITGPPGVGKSTLINAYIRELRNQDNRVAVVSVDPSSPISGGAILGDRLRMCEHIADSGVYIRSIASRGCFGGLCESIRSIAELIKAAGWDYVVLETVGAGQSEVEVAAVADVCVVVNAPGLGDDIQAMKAGILEVADILVVNKSDSPLASQSVRYLQAMLKLREPARQSVPVIQTTATDGKGLAELRLAVEKHVADHG